MATAVITVLVAGAILGGIWASRQQGGDGQDNLNQTATNENAVLQDNKNVANSKLNGTRKAAVLELPLTNAVLEAKAAKWALEEGGKVTIVVGDRTADITRDAQIPESEPDFYVKSINLTMLPNVEDHDLQNLEGLIRLDYLQLHGTSVSDAGLAHLSGLTGLDYLGLKGTSVSDIGLAHLAGLSNLTKLNLMETSVSGQGFDHLQNLTKFSRMYLSNTPLNDGAIIYFSNFQTLRILELNGTNVSDDGLEEIAKHVTLERVYLRGTRITDQGVDHILKLKNVRLLDVAGTAVSFGKIQELKTALPNCDVRY